MNTENYGIQILKCRYYSIKEKNMAAHEEMIDNPNEYSNQYYISTKKIMDEIHEVLTKLGITI